MSKKFLLLFLQIFVALQVYSQHVEPIWSVGNAKLTPRSTLVLNSTFTSRYNLNDRLQLGANLLFPIAPDFQVKYIWWDKKRDLKKRKFYSNWRWKLTSVHTFAMPAWALHLAARKHLVPQQLEQVDFNFTMQNDLFLSFPFVSKYQGVCGADRILTLKLGWRHSFFTDGNLQLPTAGFWNLQSSTFRYSDFYYAGLGYDAKWRNNLNFSQDIRFYVLKSNGLALESNSYLYFGFGVRKRSRLVFGLKAGFLSKLKKVYLRPVFDYSLFLTFHDRKKKDLDEYLRLY